MYIKHPDRYQQLIVNRVPRLVKRGVYSYDVEQIYSSLHRQGSQLIQRLLGDDRRGFAHWMISYDEYIEYQFLQPMISRHIGRMSRRKARFQELVHVIQDRYSIPPDEALKEILLNSGRFHPPMLEEMHVYLRKVDEIVKNVIHLVERSGFSYLTRLIHEEWLPGNILRDFGMAMQDALLEMGFPIPELGLLEDDRDHIGPVASDFVERIRHGMDRYIMDEKLAPREAMEQFLPSLMVVAALAVNYRWWHSPLGQELPELLGHIAVIEALHWKQRGDRQRKRQRQSMQEFLAAESLEERDWKEFGHDLHIHPRWRERGFFSHLYRECASAQARIIDLKRDAEFLIALIQRLVIEDIQEAPILPYISGIAEKVIVRKTFSHEAGQKKISKGFSSAHYMEEFSEVLEKILANWEQRQ